MRLSISTGLLLVIGLLGVSCAPSQGFEANLHSAVRPYLFSIARWELQVVPNELSQLLPSRGEKTNEEVRVVVDYFTTAKRIKALKLTLEAAAASDRAQARGLQAELNRLQEQNTALTGTVEKVIENQIRETLTRLGIYNPVIDIKVGFPPVNFSLEDSPKVLVISPSDRIESIREITLQPGISLEEMENIEAEVDKLGVSSLVAGTGGIATYPSIVSGDSSLRHVINAATEEWLHQYLSFKPLGFLYVLDLTGLSRNYDIATMNEALVGMVSDEIGSMVYEKYYSGYENDANNNQAAESGFDFNAEMREIRKTVDTYLARGEIEQAEEFMEQKRQYLVSKGYYIRKLNQAYFAFYGTYADEPAFISPIGLELKELRTRSLSLKDFLNTVAAMNSRQDLQDSLK